MSDLIAVVYPDRDTAEAVRRTLGQLALEHVIELDDAVVVTRDDKGKVKVTALERHAEHVVQHERQPLGRREVLQHHQQRQTDRVGQQRLVFGIHAGGIGDDRIRHVNRTRVQILLAPGLARAQHVQ
jgi:hypothetical protein